MALCFLGISFQLTLKTKVFALANRNTTNSTTNQSELEANTCNRRKARENACQQVAIGFRFASHWFILSQSQSTVKRKQRKRESVAKQLKTALNAISAIQRQQAAPF